MMNESHRFFIPEIKGFVPSAKLLVPKDARGTWSTGSIRQVHCKHMYHMSHRKIKRNERLKNHPFWSHDPLVAHDKFAVSVFVEQQPDAVRSKFFLHRPVLLDINSNLLHTDDMVSVTYRLKLSLLFDVFLWTLNAKMRSRMASYQVLPVG